MNRFFESIADSTDGNSLESVHYATSTTSNSMWESDIEPPMIYGNHEEEHPQHCSSQPNLIWTLAYSIAYTLVFVVGLLGNTLVILVIERTATMRRNIVHILLANLAVADLMVILVCLPPTLLGHLSGTWKLGLIMCKGVSYLQGVAVSASINTLIALSIDRYLAICYPLKVQISSSGAYHIIGGIWIFSFIVTSPWLVVFTLIPLDPEACPGEQLCSDVWPNEVLEEGYFIVANLFLCYLIPFAIIVLTCTAIFTRVAHRQVLGEASSQQAQMELLIQRSKLKVVKMMVIVEVLFLLSWLPLYAIFARLKLGPQIESGSLEERILMISAPLAQWLGISNSAINPIIYSLNKNYRKSLKVFFSRHRFWALCCPWPFCCRHNHGRNSTDDPQLDHNNSTTPRSHGSRVTVLQMTRLRSPTPYMLRHKRKRNASSSASPNVTYSATPVEIEETDPSNPARPPSRTGRPASQTSKQIGGSNQRIPSTEL